MALGRILWPLLVLSFMLSLVALARSPLVGSPSEQVQRGAALYEFNCAVCHGATGLGYEEAKRAFPEDHRACERCHLPTNPPQLRVFQMDGMAFSLGYPPALVGKDSFSAFANVGALYEYIRSSMPRYEPGRLTNEEYLALTAYLLELNDALPEETTLDEVNAASLVLKP